MKLCKYCKKELLLTKATAKIKKYCGDKCNRAFNAKRISLLRKLKYRKKKYGA